MNEEEDIEVQQLEKTNDLINTVRSTSAASSSNAKPDARRRKRKSSPNKQNDELEEEDEEPTTSNAKRGRKSSIPEFDATTPKARRVRPSSFPVWKPLLDHMNVSQLKQDAIEHVLYQISSKLSNEIVRKHMEDTTKNKCITVKLKGKSLIGFNHVVKAIRCPDHIYNPEGHFKHTKTCNTVDCVQVNHWQIGLIHENATRRNRKTKKITKAYEHITEEETNQLAHYLMIGIDEQIHDQIRERATTIAKELMVEFQVGATEMIEMLNRNECSHVEDFAAVIVKKSNAFLTLIWFLKNPLKKEKVNVKNLIQPCATNTDKKICLSLSHYIFYDDGRYEIFPSPITPANPHPSELRTTSATHTVSEDVNITNNEEPPKAGDSNEHLVVDDDIYPSPMPYADYEDDSDVEESSPEIEKEFEEECEMIKEAYAEADGNEVVTMDYADYITTVVKPLLQKFQNEKMPLEYENHKDEFIEFIHGMIRAGVQNGKFIQKADWRKLLEKAKEIVLEKASVLHSEQFRHHYEQSCNQIEIYVAFMLHFCEFLPVVQRYKETEGTATDEEMEEFIQKLSNKLIIQFISQIGSKGFSQLSAAWCYGIKSITITESGYIFLDYLAFLVAQNTLSFERFWQQFLSPQYNNEMIEKYQEFMLTTKQRNGYMMQSNENFMRGKRNQSSVKYDPMEMYKLSVSTIIGSTVVLGVACKYVGIYNKSKEGFQLGSIKDNKALKTRLIKNRITLKRDIWPLQWRDMLLYYEKCQTNSMWDIVSKTFTMIACATGWRPSSMLHFKRHTLAQEYPGVRIKDVKFGYIGGRLKYEIDALSSKIEVTAADKLTHVEVCNGRKHCHVCHLARYLAHRGVFSVPINDIVCGKALPEDLQIKPEHHMEFLFPFVDKCGIIHPNTPMPLSHVEIILDDIAMKLKIPRNLISCKSWRKGKAIECCLDIMKLPGNLPTTRKIAELLQTGKNWTSDTCLTYTYFGDDELQKCLNLCTSIKKCTSVKDFDPEKLIAHISDLSTEQSLFFTQDSDMVVEIIDAMKPIWFKTNVDPRLIMRRRKLIASIFNSFGAHYRTRSTTLGDLNDLNPASEIDFKTIFDCYPYAMTTNADIPRTCPHCSEQLQYGNMKEHFQGHGNIPFSCCNTEFSDLDKNLYTIWINHHNNTHRYKYVCRTCNVISNHSKIHTCLRATNPGHNISYLGTVHDHWLPEKDEVIDSVQIKQSPPPSTVINFSKDKKDKATALNLLQSYMDKKQHERVIGILEIWMKEETIELSTVTEILKEPRFFIVKSMLEDENII